MGTTMFLPLSFLTLLSYVLNPALALAITSSFSSPPAAYSEVLDSAFLPQNPTNLTLPLAFLQPSDISTNPLKINCRQGPTPTRRPLNLNGCAEVVFSLLGVGNNVEPLLFTTKAPWRLPATYADTRDTCEVRLKATKPDAEDYFPISLVLQSVAEIAFECRKPGQPSQSLGGTAYIGGKEMFLLDVYGPALPAEVS
ncbi:hypothetical protein OEA41_002020 [Lepraria neglecta]|uniref:Ubiquitin 3 binding protein But2 C-terminal domain-containing protein n=1 Tax=Lepraria neglecta TaxID=209136 RepID=A0AAD9ZB56_9LECA|nr:hypothetical protein OEA41_002020 [Lepraria neglecta]